MFSRVSYHLPETVLTNEALVREFGCWSDEEIVLKTGVRERRVLGPRETPADLARFAAEKVLEGVDRKGIDLLVFCTQTPDFLLPTSACVLQERLGLSSTCAAFDYNLGCSGYVYGLAIAQSMLEAGHVEKALLLTGDGYTKHIHPTDKSTRTLFGDAGTATLLSRECESATRLHSFVFGTDGSGAADLILRSGGARVPRRELSRELFDEGGGDCRNPDYLSMDGPKVFSFTIRTVPRLVEMVLGKAGLLPEDIDYYVFHQANGYMLEHLRKKIGIPRERFPVFFERIGNSVSSTIPIVLSEVIGNHGLKAMRGKRFMLVGFGVGYSWGGCILEIL